MVRFPIVGNVCDELVDEKVAMEVEVLSLIRKHTNIPVPRVKAWGRAVDNTLGLGPFIIMDFIEGVSLSTLFRASKDARLLKEDIDDHDIEFIYKQYARILLQLFRLDFEQCFHSNQFKSFNCLANHSIQCLSQIKSSSVDLSN
ncbi:hypothetical protein GJ744_003086 [Endocarpon pusillum]|uniref:Aminoglycoside phosphotransferase domain-containing protein n=1 Tax=Endocarpon pusillum TaxID=364733 RepID=A0A8H7AMG3_9EURO|nr:hypothetical protein GJ744_003086 [Endocarpon pusillum]